MNIYKNRLQQATPVTEKEKTNPKADPVYSLDEHYARLRFSLLYYMMLYRISFRENADGFISKEAR